LLNNNNSIKLDDENMDKKISDVNEMIDREEDDDDMAIKGNDCGSNRSTPTSDRAEKQHESDDVQENDDALEARDNGDRCSVNSSNMINTRTVAEELALKDKEVCETFSRKTV
jgi:hypothetical protein